jgi:signal transduction histidine kinase
MSEDDREQLLASIEKESQRLRSMIEDMLTLSRLELVPQETLEPLLLQRIIPTIVEAFRKRGNSELQVAVNLDKRLPPVTARSDFLQQMIDNLLSNAAKYSPPGKAVEVQAARGPADQVRVSVMNEGPGVERGEEYRLFERFYRSRKTPRSTRGLGLGLTVCKRLAEAQGGSVYAKQANGRLEIGFSLPSYKEAPAA